MRRVLIQLVKTNQLAEFLLDPFFGQAKFLQRIVVFTFKMTLPSIRWRELLAGPLAYLPAEVTIKFSTLIS
jgi:hypothetical protein